MSKGQLPHNLQLSIQAQDKANRTAFGSPEAMFERKLPASPKVERENFSLPVEEHAMIGILQKRVAQELDDIGVTRSQIIRAGLLALQRLGAPELLSVAQEVKRQKPGKRKNS
jgi:hypothetical protein